MNRQGKGKIEWCDYTWSPVVGCKHDCFYCYGKKIAKRFFKDNPNYEPRFYPERLKEPCWTKKPSKIFVCSMADLFGEWVPKDWIEKILGVVSQNPQHTFQFLTKNPERYLEFDFPENCWLGTTCESWAKYERVIWLIEKKMASGNKTFISIEPLLGEWKWKFQKDKKFIDLVIVGAMTGPNAIEPKQEWIKSIKHKNIFYKNNIKKYL